MPNKDYQPVQIRKDIHARIKALSALNDLKLRDLATALLSEILTDEERVKQIIKKLKVSG